MGRARTTAGLALALLAAPIATQREEPALDYWLYVAAESADEVYKVRFDGEKAEVAKMIDVGVLPTEIEGPHGLTVSPDGEHWFLSMAHGQPFGVLYKYSTETDELVAQTELGLFPATMQISKATGLLYCVNFDLHGDMQPSSVSIVDPDGMVEVARTTTGPMPHGSRLSADGLHHYSCAMMSAQLFEIDAVDFEVKRTLALDELGIAGHAHGAAQKRRDPGEKELRPAKPTWVHPHPTRPMAYVALNGIDEIAEVDLERWRIVRRFPTDRGPYNVEVTPDGKKLLVSYKSAGAIGIWDIDGGRELARIPSSRSVTHGVMISPDGRYGFVSSEGKGAEQGTVDVIDMTENKLVCTVGVGLQAGGLAFWRAVPHKM